VKFGIIFFRAADDALVFFFYLVEVFILTFGLIFGREFQGDGGGRFAVPGG
jgi:hypothetical protein